MTDRPHRYVDLEEDGNHYCGFITGPGGTFAPPEICGKLASEHPQRKPGQTVAESLGIEVPDNAPGGRKLFTSSPKPAVPKHYTTELEYQGFGDVDGYNHPSKGTPT